MLAALILSLFPAHAYDCELQSYTVYIDADGDGYGAIDSEQFTGCPDDDGYSATNDDCDDGSDTVHPNLQESCEVGDQIDNDCNGDVNTAEGYTALDSWIEGTHPELYVDADGDGFGEVDSEAAQACEVVSGYATTNTDCDDDSNITYPGADEICDELDQNCDKMVDEPDSLAENSGCVDAYQDQDGDGYGDADNSVCLCLYGDDETVNPNDGEVYTTQAGDCDDTDASYYEDCPESDTGSVPDGDTGDEPSGENDYREVEDKEGCEGESALLLLPLGLMAFRRRSRRGTAGTR